MAATQTRFFNFDLASQQCEQMKSIIAKATESRDFNTAFEYQSRLFALEGEIICADQIEKMAQREEAERRARYAR